ncbi:hypothetical protein [Actinoplanes sp. NPDC051411]|uniref:hypothetical protein n=1 Tax=Actinoplanes sp. NPDC051411 TaxID=3155522 RepID=UPI00343FD627
MAAKQQNRILYLRTFRSRPDHRLVVSLALAVANPGKLVIVGPAEDEARLRQWTRAHVSDDNTIHQHIEYIVCSDDQWRREVNLQISKASCVLLYMAPKRRKFPSLRAPKAGDFEDFYSSPVKEPVTGPGLLREIVYLRRLDKLKSTLLLCAASDLPYFSRLLRDLPIHTGLGPDMTPLLGFYLFQNTPKGLQPMVPRISAYDRQLVNLRAARGLISFRKGVFSRSSQVKFSHDLTELVNQVIRDSRSSRVQPDVMLGRSPRPRRLPPDGARKIIEFTNVEDLLYIPRYEIADVGLAEVLEILAEPEANHECLSCGASLSDILFYVRGLDRAANSSIRGRCQFCFEPMIVESGQLRWWG